MAHKFIRLQGPEWADYRRIHKLRLLGISKSDNGNYRANMKDENNVAVCHWLNPYEVEKLESSGWFNTHNIYEFNRKR